MYLLDSNILSETRKPYPNAGLKAWLKAANDTELYSSVLVFGEIQKGILRLPATESKFSTDLQAWLDELTSEFGDRVLPIDHATALLWGELTAHGQQSGKTPPAIDTLITAQALQNGLTLVTRNAKDFEQFEDLKLLCPWT